MPNFSTKRYVGQPTCSWRASLKLDTRLALDDSTNVSCSIQSLRIVCCPCSSSTNPDPFCCAVQERKFSNENPIIFEQIYIQLVGNHGRWKKNGE